MNLATTNECPDGWQLLVLLNIMLNYKKDTMCMLQLNLPFFSLVNFRFSATIDVSQTIFEYIPLQGAATAYSGVLFVPRYRFTF